MLLEHQRTSRARLGDRLFIGKHAARTGLLQPGNQMQQGRLAATRRSNQSHQFTLGELTAEALDDFELPEALVYFFKPELHKNPQIQKRNCPAMRAMQTARHKSRARVVSNQSQAIRVRELPARTDRRWHWCRTACHRGSSANRAPAECPPAPGCVPDRPCQAWR